MSSLPKRLRAMRKKHEAAIKPDLAEKIERHIAELNNSGMVRRALKVGAKAPPFVLRKENGQLVSSCALLERGLLVVSFYRGTWCPYCNEEMEALNASYERFRALGAELVGITPQSVESAAAYRSEHSIAFPILVDPDAKVAASFGLAYSFPAYLIELYKDAFHKDLTIINATGTWRLPIPARFVIDRDGIIVDAQVDADYRHRPDPEETLAVLEQLVRKAHKKVLASTSVSTPPLVV